MTRENWSVEKKHAYNNEYAEHNPKIFYYFSVLFSEQHTSLYYISTTLYFQYTCMRDFRKRMIIRSVIYSPLTAGILIILTFFVLQATVKIFNTYLETKKKYGEALNTFAELKGREENLKERIQMLTTERGVEEEIRNKFGLIKEGEEVVIIVEPPASTATGSTKEERGTSFWDTLGSFLNIFR